MKDKKILEFFNNKTKDIKWEIVKKEGRYMTLKGDFAIGTIYMFIVPSLLIDTGDYYWDIIKKELYSKIGEKLYSKENK